MTWKRTVMGVGPWVGVVVLAAFATVTSVRLTTAQAELNQLRDWRGGVLAQLTEANRDPRAGPPRPLTPAEAPDALSRLIATRDGALKFASAQQVEPRSPAAVPGDASPPGKSASSEISRLRGTTSTGSAAGDAQIIETDSRAAWTGWK